MPEPADRIESLFAAAVALPPGEREAYLERECSGDPALSDRLLALLNAHDRAGHVIDRPVDVDPDQTAGYAPTSEHEQPGTIIAGRYKLLEEIGQGGMGTVWAAEQTTPVRRKVALKLIKAGMDSRSVLARFEAERQALALMDHPNIAKVLDGGLTDSGRPFFVMEYVKGVPITEYCDATRLSVEDRLKLFSQVCSAVQHAHQKGIIHRDLKPSNILVAAYDDKPVPKVIDFGLAKAMHQSLTEKTLYTAHETVLGTPLYMSPEQAQLNNLDVDTRADIYSLGVLLYELLTGTTPLERKRFKEAAWDEIRRMIREEEPPRPSVRLSSTDTLPSLATFRDTEPEKLKRLVRGELDWIVMKALEKDRTRRYETAIALVQDIERFTNHEPLSAGPPTAAYRIRKFARRHRLAIATSSAFALLLLAATAVSAGLAVWANRERLRAVQAEQRAKDQQARTEDREQMAVTAVRRYADVVRETPELKNDPSLAKLRARLLKEPQGFFGSLRDRLQADRETTNESLARLAAASYELGRLTDEIGDKRDALRAHEESLSIRERLRENPSIPEFQHDLALSYYHVAGLEGETGRLTDAVQSYTRAQAILEQLSRDNPPVAKIQRDLARIYHGTGVAYRKLGQSERGLAAQERARDIQQLMARQHPSESDFQNDLAMSHNAIGMHYRAVGRPATALESFDKALPILKRLALEHASDTMIQRNLAGIHNNIGGALEAMGRPEEAVANFDQARKIWEQLARENPSVTEFQDYLAGSLSNFGLLQSRRGHPEEALKAFEQAGSVQERLVREHPESPEFASRLGATLNNMAILDLEQRRFEQARTKLLRAVELQRKTLATNPGQPNASEYLANHLKNLIAAAEGLGLSEEASAARRELAELIANRTKPDAPEKRP